MKKKVVVFATYSLFDPPIQNIVNFFIKKSWEVVVIHPPYNLPEHILDFKVVVIKDFSKLNIPGFIKSIIAWINYYLKARKILATEHPDLIIAEMHRPLSVIPKSLLSKTVCFIPDIPSLTSAGKLDKYIIKSGWKNMHNCKLIWASDKYKAEYAKVFAKLNQLPITCHNCPAIDYLKSFNKSESRNWLLNSLTEKGIEISKDPIILLRAGAIGPYGGIEETLEIMPELNSEIIFVMMGRPSADYKRKVLKLADELNIASRVHLFDRPTDIEWKKILFGSDIGHLIHLRPKVESPIADNYDLNSSLSNNRLFQYMASSLPILSYKDARMKDIYDEVDCFEVVNPDNLKEEVLEKIQILSSHKSIRDIKGANGMLAFMHKYNWESQFKFIEEEMLNHKYFNN